MSRVAPLGPRGLEVLRDQLSERDMDVVRGVAQLRYMTTLQIQSMHFPEHASDLSAARICRRVLERLTKARLLTRLERRIGGVRAGSSAFVYGLGPAGDRLVRADQARRRWREPSRTFLDHTLAIAQVVVDLAGAVHAGGCEVLAIETEPQCWRRVEMGLGAGETLKPDLFVVVGRNEYEYRWFVEVDRDTAHVPTVMRKCKLYDSYYRNGAETRAHGVFPKVVFAVPGAARAERLKKAIKAERGLTAELFEVVTADRLLPVLCGGPP